MADYEGIADTLRVASDIYFKSKSLDLLEAREAVAQTNLEIDRRLGEKRLEKEMEFKLYDSQIQRAQATRARKEKEFDVVNENYQALTGNIVSLPDQHKTSNSLDMIGQVEEGVFGKLKKEITDINALITRLDTGKMQALSRIEDISKMKTYISGGAGGFEGGTDPKVYDPGDFMLEDEGGYADVRGIDLDKKPWLREAYVQPTQMDIAKMNKAMGLDPMSLINIEYKQHVIQASRESNEATKSKSTNLATDKAYKSIYTNVAANTLNPFSDLLKQSTIVSGYSDEERIDQSAAYALDVAKFQRAKDNLAASIDPLSYNKILQSVEGQGLSLDIIRQYNSTGQIPKGLTEIQQATLTNIAPKIQQALETMYVEGFNAVQGLKGAAGVPGTGLDLMTLSKKRAMDYNDLIKEGKLMEAQELAFAFEQVTGIDVSSQEAMNEFQLKVDNEGFVSIDDASLQGIITPDKDPDKPFKLTTDYLLLKNAHDSGNKELTRTLVPQIIQKYGRAEVLKSIAGWSDE